MELWEELDFKIVLNVGGVIGSGNDHIIIEGAFLAVAKKAPPHFDGMPLISFEYDPQHVLAAEKKLKNKMRIVDLIGALTRELGEVNRIGNFGGPSGIGFEGNRLEGKEGGRAG